MPRPAQPAQQERPLGHVPHLRNTIGPVDLVWVVVFCATVAYWFHALRDTWFFLDEWPMADQVRYPRGVFQPYNGHLTPTMLAGYRILLGLVGFSTHAPYRLMGLLSFSSLALTFYLTTRSKLTPPIAAVGSFLLLWSPHLSLESGSLNHSLAMAGGIICAHFLPRTGRRADLAVAATLTFALCTSGLGVAVAAAAVTHSALRRAGLSRWVAVATPTIAWILWRVLAVPDTTKSLAGQRPPPGDLLVRSLGDALDSFSQLTLGNDRAGAVLALAFAALFVARLRSGTASNMAAWTVALVVWRFGLEWSRWFLPLDDVYRYDVVSAAMILVAVVPEQLLRVKAPALSVITDRAIIGAGFVAAFAVCLTLAVHHDFRSFRELHSTYGQIQRRQSVVVDLGPKYTPNSTNMGVPFDMLSAGDLRTLFSGFGPPEGHDDLPRLLAESVKLELLPATEPTIRCEEAGSEIKTGPLAIIALAASEMSATVEVRRFGSDWVRVGTIPAGWRAKITLRSVLTDEPWELRAPGACVVSG